MSELDKPDVSDAAPVAVDSPDDRGGPVVGGDPRDSFQAALDQFDEAVPTPTAPAAPAADPGLNEYLAQSRALGFTDEDALAIASPELQTKAELSKEREVLHDHYARGLLHLQQIAEQVSRERDRMDFDRLLHSLRGDFPDISQRVLEQLLVGRYHSSERVAGAWRSRYRSPGNWSREIERVRSELRADLSSRIDVDQTETRAAIAAAVTRGGGLAPRETEMPNLNKMSDAELAQFTKENFGY